MEKISFKSKKFDFLKESEVEKNLEPNSDRFGLNQNNSNTKNYLTDCLMRFLFFSRATFFRRCLQRVVMVVILFFITPLISCIDSEGNIYYSIKVNASEFEDNIDYNNIYNLWEQPLRVMKKTVEGEWKIGTFSSPSGNGAFKNTFVTITEDRVIITKDETEPNIHIIPDSFSYRWETRKEWHYRYIYSKDSIQLVDSVLRSLYVMVSDDKTIEWNFLDIENSRLRGKNFESGKIFMFFRNN